MAKVKVPRSFMGRTVEGSIKRVGGEVVLDPLNGEDQVNLTGITFPNIKPEDFLLVPGTNIAIEKYPSEKPDSMQNWSDNLEKRSHFFPSLKQFTTHLCNVYAAVEGKVDLFYASGKLVPQEEVLEIYERLTRPRGGGGNIILDAKFSTLGGKYVLESGYRTQKKGDGIEVRYMKHELENSLNGESMLVNLTFDSKGFPTQKSELQEYRHRKNLKYTSPTSGGIARFFYDQKECHLYCRSSPSDSGFVIACVEAVGEQNGNSNS